MANNGIVGVPQFENSCSRAIYELNVKLGFRFYRFVSRIACNYIFALLVFALFHTHTHTHKTDVAISPVA